MTSLAEPSLPILIVGGGYSGTMLAARLAELGQTSILIERSGTFGLGVAYSAHLDDHRLNVRTERMGAVASRVGDFATWLAQHHPDYAGANGFAPRRLYGLYVQARLAAVEQSHPDLIQRLTGEATALDATTLTLSDGHQVEGRAVVLATGNPAPRTASSDASPRILPDPWATGALSPIGATDEVLILGSGLTMVDVVMALEAQGWAGRATTVSRRGLMPRAHGPHHDAPAPLPAEALTGPLSQRLATFRTLAREHGWRRVMEGYRPITTALWREASTAQRARFLRHLRPWWDVHRHRIASEVAAKLDSLIASDRLKVCAGRIGTVAATADQVSVSLTPRGGQPLTRTAQWVIDCTGPGHDAASAPLTGRLIAEGRARLDGLRLGLDLDETGRLLHVDGQADQTVFVLGPPARAALWETIAIPDIRNRIEVVATALVAGA